MAPWLIWIAMAVLAALAAIPLLAPIARPRRAPGSSAAHAAAIYRDQLSEIERDVASGVLAEREAAAARTEIARRLIRTGDEPEATSAAPGRTLRAAAAIVIAMPVAAFALYFFVGSPEYPDQPLGPRLAASQGADMATLIAAVEERLATTPDDGAGWEVIAPVYLRLGRSADAVTAYANAIRLLGADADRETGLGEAIVAASGGTVVPEAVAAFERARALAPAEPRPRLYLALALQQQGRNTDALAAWRAVLDDALPDAEWRPLVEAQIAALGAAPAPGPTAADIEAAAALPEEDQAAMIEGMVASLAARLETDGSDADGWARLVRSYMVLGRPDDARAALARAEQALAGDATGLAAVMAVARETGLMEE